MPPREPGTLTGRKKAAILMLSLGPEIAADVYRSLADSDIEQITLEIANLMNVTGEHKSQVIEEFYHTAMAKQYMSHGGVNTAKEILEKALGPGKTMEILERLQGVIAGRPFDFLKHVNAAELINFVRNEHPQTIALILAHLTNDQAALILSELPPDTQQEVAIRIASMEHTSPEIITDVERILEKKLSNILSSDFREAGGVDALAEMLNQVDPTSGKKILESIQEQDVELAAEVKKRMFTFDDLIMLDDRSMQRVLSSIDMKELAAALKGAGDDVRKQVFSNLSARAAGILQEDIDLMGPVRVQQVEESQQRIVSILRSLEENGEIIIHRPGQDEMVN
ncbi:MAG: flagellar motor switch protein FliG [Candidatus Hinthialibacter antarcticus]|nr:flagellar motor switch protein FliG [Candidatus Hinthialibacter antarcticus]